MDRLKAIEEKVDAVLKGVNLLVSEMKGEQVDNPCAELVLNGAEECEAATVSLREALANIESLLKSGAVAKGVQVQLNGLLQSVTPEQLARAREIATTEIKRVFSEDAKGTPERGQDIDGDEAVQCENCLHYRNSAHAKTCHDCSDFDKFNPNPERIKGCYNCGSLGGDNCQRCFCRSLWTPGKPERNCGNCGRMCMGSPDQYCDDWEEIKGGG